MKPSFIALFKRGKYNHSPVAPGPHGESVDGPMQPMQERERFAAAAIAFAFEHCATFRIHFFDKVCRILDDPSLSADAQDWAISIEPERWADLLVVNRKGDDRYVYAIECKIDAGLQPHQNPTAAEFCAAGGYGRLMVEQERAAGTKLRFIVLGYPSSLDLSAKAWSAAFPHLEARHHLWSSLAASLPGTSLSTDLGRSLGKLGIRAFRSPAAMNTKLDLKSTDLWRTIDVLDDVVARLGLASSQYECSRDENGYAFGYSLLAGNTPVAQSIQQRISPPQKWLSWFGYRKDDDGVAELSVWFYCGSEDAQNAEVDRLSVGLRGRLPKAKVVPETKRIYFSVVVSEAENTLPSDSDWFTEVFRGFGVPNL